MLFNLFKDYNQYSMLIQNGTTAPLRTACFMFPSFLPSFLSSQQSHSSGLALSSLSRDKPKHPGWSPGKPTAALLH